MGQPAGTSRAARRADRLAQRPSDHRRLRPRPGRDGTDNFPTRYLLNDACALLGKPDVWGSIDRFDGQASIWWAKHGPCYRCVFPESPSPGLVASCDEGGVLGVVCAAVGSIQAVEVVELIVGIGDPLVGRLMVHDALR